MVQTPRSKNPNYWVQIINETAGINIKADLPQSVAPSVKSEYTTWDRFATPLNTDILGVNASGGFGGGILLREFTKKIWQGCSGIAMTLPLIFDAETSGQEDVHAVAEALMTLCSPYRIGDGVYSILLPPNPTRMFGTNNTTTVRIGRLFFFESVAPVDATYTVDVKLDKYGYPIAGQVDFSFETEYVVDRNDLKKIMGSNTPPR